MDFILLMKHPLKMSRFFCFLLFAVSTPILAQEGNFQDLSDKGLTPFPWQQGVVIYEISGDANGTAELTFSQNGWRQIMKSDYTYKQYGVEAQSGKTEIRNGDFLYEVKNGGSKGKSTKDKSLSDLLGYKEPQASWDALYTSQSGTKTGTENILNYECDVWTFEKGITNKIWSYKGLILKSEKMVGKLKVTSTATSFEEKDNIDESFAIEGVTWD